MTLVHNSKPIRVSKSDWCTLAHIVKFGFRCVTNVVDTAHQAAFTNCVSDYQTQTTKASNCTQPALADSDP